MAVLKTRDNLNSNHEYENAGKKYSYLQSMPAFRLYDALIYSGYSYNYLAQHRRQAESGDSKQMKNWKKAINNENIVRYIKYKRLSWLGHVERMTNERVAKTIYKWKPYASRSKGRPRVRWEDDVRNDLRKMGVTNWKQRTQERKKGKK